MLQGWQHMIVAYSYIMIVTALLEQRCNKSDNINKLATG